MKQKLTNAELEMLGFATEENVNTVENSNARTFAPCTDAAPRPSFAATPRRVVVLTDPMVGTFVRVNKELGMIDGYYPNIGMYGFITSDKDSWTGRLVSPNAIETLADTTAARAAAKQYYEWESEHLQRRVAMNSGNLTKLVDLLSEVAYWQERLA